MVAERRIDVVLPTHEQAWLFAAASPPLSDLPVAVADAASFDRVQSKVEFARLLDEIGLAQPRWRLVRGNSDLDGLSFPYWLKSAFSTAGRGVRLVTDERSRADAERKLLEQGSGPVMAQEPAAGQYGQVQALFDRGRLVAAHTSVQTGIGIGPSAAARQSVDHPRPPPGYRHARRSSHVARGADARLLPRAGRGELHRVQPTNGRARQRDREWSQHSGPAGSPHARRNARIHSAGGPCGCSHSRHDRPGPRRGRIWRVSASRRSATRAGARTPRLLSRQR